MYKIAQTVMDAKELKTSWQDMVSDFAKGFLKIVTDDVAADFGSGNTKFPGSWEVVRRGKWYPQR